MPPFTNFDLCHLKTNIHTSECFLICGIFLVNLHVWYSRMKIIKGKYPIYDPKECSGFSIKTIYCLSELIGYYVSNLCMYAFQLITRQL